MNQFGLYILHLLKAHQCVIVPYLGGFVSRTNTLSDMQGNKEWYPHRLEISFNADLSHNDGLLSQLIMQTRDVDFRQASLWIREKVLAIRWALLTQKECRLPYLGLLTVSEENLLCFQPEYSPCWDPSCYGLSPFIVHKTEDMQPILPQSAWRDSSEKEVKVFIKKGVLYRTAAAAALFLTLMFTGEPLNRPLKTGAEYAGLLPTPAFHSMKLSEISASRSKHYIDSINRAADMEASVASIEISTREEGGKFYVVAAIVPSLEVAKDLVFDLQNKGFNKASIKELGHQRIVYIDQFSEREAARQFISALHSSPFSYPVQIKKLP